MIIDPGWLGSPIDVATFIVVVVGLVVDVRPKLKTIAAALVALARRERGVDDEHLQAELGVDDRDVEQVEPTVIDCGGEGRDAT